MANFVTDLFTNAPATAAAAGAQATRNAGLATAQQQIAQGGTAATAALGQARSTYEGARQYLDPITPGAQGAWSSYAQLVGAAPESTPGSVENTLVNQPGFQFAEDRAAQAAARASAASGMSNSGNALESALAANRQLTEANIGSYAGRLLAMAGYAPQIAGQQIGISGQEAGTYNTQASNDIAQSLAQAGLTTNVATANASDVAAAENARSAAASNVWNAIMGVAGLGVKTATGMWGVPGRPA